MIMNGRKRFPTFGHAGALLLLWGMLVSASAYGGATAYDSLALDKPVDVTYLQKHLRKGTPRLVLTPELETRLRDKLETDSVVKNMYRAIRLSAGKILTQPLLERIMTGRRLLSVSREMLYRMNILGMVYRMEEDPAVLTRIDEELNAVCSFADWNPSHYLDVAEMALAVALAVDWTGHALPDQTVALAKTALIEKGILPGFQGNNWWVKANNNWNQVCNGGMIAASIAIAETDPELAAKTIARALDGIPNALNAYGPDGVYPEGSTYWSYGTGFSVLTASMLESAFGNDFGLAAYPAFMKSADFRLLSTAPSGYYYNFFDCGDHRETNGDLILAWFAAKTGNPIYYETDRFLQDPGEMEKLSRHAGAGLVWLAEFEKKEEKALPMAWKGRGVNPVIFFRSDPADASAYYLGAKGGRASSNHGNMDAGSFVFELDGVRWVIDPGNQAYHAIEKTGFDLWSSCQDCPRWTLLTKNNFGHSTLTVNNELHRADGFAELTRFEDGPQPRAEFDLTPVFGNTLDHAERHFLKNDDASLLIEDKIEINKSTKLVTWQLITKAEVTIQENKALLSQDGKKLEVENLSHPDVRFEVISLDPPPLELDRKIRNLKRLEIRFPAERLQDGSGTIRVRLQRGR